MNTKQNGTYRFIAFREDDHYIAACLELNLVEKGNDLIAVKRSVEESASAFIDTIRTENLPDSYLNQKPPAKYLEVLERIEKVARLDIDVVTPKTKRPEFEAASLSYQQYNFA